MHKGLRLVILILLFESLCFSSGIVNSETVVLEEKRLTLKMIRREEKEFKKAVDKYVDVLKARRKANIERLRQTSSILVLKKTELLELESLLHQLSATTNNIMMQVDLNSLR